MVRLILLGGPGSGRGTQSQNLSQYFEITAISTGSILKEAIAGKSTLGNTAKTYVEKGEWVPDSIMIKFMEERLLERDVENGWILEGYPRTAFQAEELDFLLKRIGQNIPLAIYLEIKESVMLDRCLARAGAEDRTEIIERRIANFQASTIPILEYYDFRGKLLRINGQQSPKQVTRSILNEIKSQIRS